MIKKYVARETRTQGPVYVDTNLRGNNYSRVAGMERGRSGLFLIRRQTKPSLPACLSTTITIPTIHTSESLPSTVPSQLQITREVLATTNFYLFFAGARSAKDT
ncbi:hypothetical protein E2C01_062236 [Portunus trituberculatus]|uniref:Uncharacterized protein n=1 Tax=Portunus trituberculatus TaxID=210409 RepID=A0A5B7HDH9_PORTR|nr:hypothetical protein [Portunus trituberculatus]